MGYLQNQKGMSLIRHAMEVMHSIVKREGKKGSVSAVICGCSRDCGFARFKESKPKEEGADFGNDRSDHR